MLNVTFGVCAGCERATFVSSIPCRTMYADESLNVSPVLCPACADAYNEYWDAMWDEYYRGLGV